MSFLSLLPATHHIGTEPVPEWLSLRPNLVWIVVIKTQGGEIKRFQLPAQWTPAEAAALIYEIRGTVWQQGEDGVPIHYEEISQIYEEFCKVRSRDPTNANINCDRSNHSRQCHHPNW